METQRPPARPVEQSLETVEELHNEWTKRKARSDARERIFQRNKGKIQTYFQSLLAKAQGKETGEIARYQEESYADTYNTTEMKACTDALQDTGSRQKVEDMETKRMALTTQIWEEATRLLVPSLDQPRTDTHIDSFAEVDIILPDTGTTDLRVVRRTLVEESQSIPKRTTYKITHLTIAVASAIQNHHDQGNSIPDYILMHPHTKHLLAVINIEDYIYPHKEAHQQKVITFCADESIDIDTLVCISH